VAIILNILKSMSPLHSTVVTYQEYSDGIGPSPKGGGGPEPARPPSKSAYGVYFSQYKLGLLRKST